MRHFLFNRKLRLRPSVKQFNFYYTVDGYLAFKERDWRLWNQRNYDLMGTFCQCLFIFTAFAVIAGSFSFWIVRGDYIAGNLTQKRTKSPAAGKG